MKVLVSEKLSEHKYKTPEGYLICTDAILARTGKQSYTKDELFQDGDDTEVNVDRPYDEVMNAKTIASFENKPITFDHPDEDVNVGNYKDYAIGYVRDVHQGKTDKGEDVILGNLVITDQDAVNAIEQGDHTDLSCGYDCDIKDDGNGNYSQTNIRGNHLALCEQGRAGIAHIVDSKVKDNNLLGKRVRIRKRYSNLDGTIGTIYSYEGTNYDDEVEVKRNGHIYKVNYEDIEFLDSKVKDSYYDTDDIDRYGNKFRNLSREYSSKLRFKANGRFTHIEGQKNDIKDFLDDYFGPNMGPYSIRDNKIEDATTSKILYGRKFTFDTISGSMLKEGMTIYNPDKGFIEPTFFKILKIHNTDKSDNTFIVSYKSVLVGNSVGTKVISKNKMYEVVLKIDKTTDSRIEDADEWTIKNTGLAYEVWNGGKFVKKFATKKQAIEWIHSRFPEDKIVEDSKIHDYRLSGDYVYFNTIDELRGKSLSTEIAKKWSSKYHTQLSNIKIVNKRYSGANHEIEIQFLADGIDDYDGAYAVIGKTMPEDVNKIRDSKEMTMSDAIKMLNIVDAYKKVRDADVNFLIKGKKVKTNVYNRNKLDFGSILNLGRKYNINVEQMFRGSNTDFWLTTDITNKDNLFKMMHELNSSLSTYSLANIFEKALKK